MFNVRLVENIVVMENFLIESNEMHNCRVWLKRYKLFLFLSCIERLTQTLAQHLATFNEVYQATSDPLFI